jgi:DNA-binding NtrC family response regulator
MNVTKKRLLVVVDDDRDIQKLISDFFRPKNFMVQCYSDADSAIAESLIHGEDWDVLLTDYHFPNMLSVEFTKKIKSHLPFLPIIMIRPIELAETAVEAIRKGAYDFI